MTDAYSSPFSPNQESTNKRVRENHADVYKWFYFWCFVQLVLKELFLRSNLPVDCATNSMLVSNVNGEPNESPNHRYLFFSQKPMCTMCLIIQCTIIIIRGTVNFVDFVGWPIHEFNTNTSTNDLFLPRSQIHEFACPWKSKKQHTKCHADGDFTVNIVKHSISAQLESTILVLQQMTLDLTKLVQYIDSSLNVFQVN